MVADHMDTSTMARGMLNLLLRLMLKLMLMLTMLLMVMDMVCLDMASPMYLRWPIVPMSMDLDLDMDMDLYMDMDLDMDMVMDMCLDMDCMDISDTMAKGPLMLSPPLMLKLKLTLTLTMLLMDMDMDLDMDMFSDMAMDCTDILDISARGPLSLLPTKLNTCQSCDFILSCASSTQY